MPFEFPIPVQIAWYKTERFISRPVRNLTFGRLYRRHVKIVKITGSHVKTTASKMTANVLKAAGFHTGLSCSDGIFVDGERVPGKTHICYYANRRVLRHHDVTAAVMECAAGGEVMYGQYVPRCEVAALLNVSAMHTGQYGLETVDDIGRTKRDIVKTATGTMVVNADDEQCAVLADEHPDVGLIGFSMRVDSPVLTRWTDRAAATLHLDQSGSTIMLTQRGSKPVHFIDIADVPATAGGLARHLAGSAMAAAGIGLALGADASAIRTGLMDTGGFMDARAGRFDVFRSDDLTLVVDKALGPVALEEGLKAQARVTVPGKRVAVVSAPEATNDEVLNDMVGLIVDAGFEHHVCHDMRKGENSGTAERLADALKAQSVPPGKISVADDLVSACREAKQKAEANGLVFAQIVYPAFLDVVKKTLGVQ